MRFAVLRQDDRGDLFGRPVFVDIPSELATERPWERNEFVEFVLSRAFGTDGAPADRRLERAIVIPVRETDSGSPSPGVVAVPVRLKRPEWNLSDVQTIGGGS